MRKAVMFWYHGDQSPLNEQPWLDTSEDDSGEEKEYAAVKIGTPPPDRDQLAQRLVFACVGNVPRSVNTRQLVQAAKDVCAKISFIPTKEAWFVVSWNDWLDSTGTL